ncbi:hypothetical protein BURMUCGD1_6613 [Burkholderia multivorans CGD1]|nr:hypothetical protein BURMUCGD1_6613 [Burkholderia multivorans CGD1]
MNDRPSAVFRFICVDSLCASSYCLIRFVNTNRIKREKKR